MRVTNSMISDTITRYLMQQSRDLQKVQEQISSQKRINRPSDDPVGIRKVLDYRNQMATVEQYLDNVDRGTTRLEFTEITLKMVDELMAVVREISQTQAKGSTVSRDLAAKEVRNLYDQTVELASSKLGKNYMFAGHQTDTPAFGHIAEGTVAIAVSIPIDPKTTCVMRLTLIPLNSAASGLPPTA